VSLVVIFDAVDLDLPAHELDAIVGQRLSDDAGLQEAKAIANP
jgi:hypothetical protein